jgi:hypothetical protein
MTPEDDEDEETPEVDAKRVPTRDNKEGAANKTSNDNMLPLQYSKPMNQVSTPGDRSRELTSRAQSALPGATGVQRIQYSLHKTTEGFPE